jgi:hypothetical protein
MKLYCFVNSKGEVLCKDYTLFVSTSDEDRLITYRRLADAKIRKKDKSYWKHRSINIDDFAIMEIELSAKFIQTIKD